MIVNAKDKDGQSPLSYAAKNGHSEVMQLFLGQGDIDVNSKDEGLQSLLLYVTKNGHLEIVQPFIVQVYIGVDVKDKCGWSLLWYATKNEHLEIVQQTSKVAHQHIESFYNTSQVWVVSYFEYYRCQLEC